MILHRLLEPSLIVWNLGKFTVAFNVMMVIMACFFYAFVDREGHSAKINGWSETMKSKVLQVYFCLVSSYFLMCLSLAISTQSWVVGKLIGNFPKHVVITSIAIMTFLTYTLQKVPTQPSNNVIRGICWALQAMVMGPCFAFFGNDICMKAVITTALAILLANFLAITANTEFFDQIKVEVTLLYVVVSITTGLCLVYRPPFTTWTSILVALNVFGGILLHFAMYVTNVQATIRDLVYNEVDPMYTSAVILICSINLYFRIAFFHVVEDSGALPSIHGGKCRN
uniref:Growth hormone-inducible transmembrane protein n=1 Tax=Lygus hesperus TaxID=30085 RepID=A0A0A9X9W7_LYGHE